MIEVNRGLDRDVEVGCMVWSTTIHSGNGYAGGCVIDIEHDDDHELVYTVVRFGGSGTQYPFLEKIPASDVDQFLVDYHTRAARTTSLKIFKWLGAQKQPDLQWAERATRLAFAGDRGSLLPKAEERYKRLAAEEREAIKNQPKKAGWL